MQKGQPLVFSGDALRDEEKIVDAMVKMSGLRAGNTHIKDPFNWFGSSVADFYENNISTDESALVVPIQEVWTGDMLQVFSKQANHVVGVADKNDRYGGSALLRFNAEGFAYNVPPIMEVIAFGADVDIESGTINKRYLAKVVETILEHTRECVEILSKLTLSQSDDDFEPALRFDPAPGLQQQVTAGGTERGLVAFLEVLETLEQAVAATGSGFTEKAEDVDKAFQELKRKLPDHALVNALESFRSLQSLSSSLDGTDVRTYERAVRIATAIHRVIDAIREGVQESGDCLYPGTVDPTYKFDVQTSGEGISIACRDAQRTLLGLLDFKNAESHDYPTIEFSEYAQGTGITSALAAKLLSEMDTSTWFRRMVNGK